MIVFQVFKIQTYLKKAIMSATYSEIYEDIKMARENALFGSYDTSLVYYQGVLQQIQKLLVSVKDAQRRAKFQKVNINLPVSV